MSATAVLLVNVGTPRSPRTRDVRRYLSQFLNDERVIDLPWLGRKLLVNGVIVPFRAPKSAKLYQKIWTDNGSPLLYYSELLAEKLQHALGEDYHIELAMRYQHPSIADALSRIDERGCDRIVVVPLFPQYASSTTGSVLQEVMQQLKTRWSIPPVTTVSAFFNNSHFIDSFATNIERYRKEEFDHVFFSYHGLPLRHLRKLDGGHDCEAAGCCEEYDSSLQFQCYQAECYETTRLLVERLDIAEGMYSVAFQSRLSKDWMQPFADKHIEQLAKDGCRRLLVVCPSFVTDCLETVYEIGEEYNELFINAGGSHLELVESLNAHSHWVDALKEIVRECVN